MASDGKVVISTALDNKGLEKGVNSISGSLGGLKSVLKGVGSAITAAFSIAAIVRFGAEASKAAMQLSDAMTGLQSIMEGQGRSFSDAQAFIEEYTKDGLIPATNAITAYKNLAMRGYDDSQIRSVMNALKDASAYGRQASYTMGEAVQSATEGLKNENSILVDNAGVTKNVAKMWEEYASSIGTTANNLTQAQKIQAEVNGILEESKYQTGDAAKVAGTLSGQLQQLSFNFNNLKVAVGNIVNPIVQAFLPAINSAVSAVTRFANAIASVVGGIFGKAVVQTEAIAESATAGAAAQEDLADGVTKADKAVKKSLAGFDELNKLQGADASTGSTPGGGDGTNETTTVSVDVEDKASPALESFVDRIKKLFDPIRQIDLTPAKEAFAELGGSVSKFTAIISDKLEWAWFNILVPLGKWTIEKAVPKVAELLAEAFDAFGKVIDAVWPALEKLWEDFLKPLAGWTGEVIINALGETADLIHDLVDLVSGEISFSEFLSGLTPTQTALASIITSLITIKTVAFGMKSFKAITDFVKSIKSLNAVGIIGKLGEVFAITSSGAGTFSEAMEFAFGKGASIIAGIAAVAAGITLVVTGVKDFIKNGASLKNMILIIGGAIATAVGLATMGIGPLIAAIIGLVTAVAAFTAAILLEEPAIMSVEEAQKNLTAAKAAAAEAENGYINAVDAAESALTRLKEAEEAAGVTGADLYAQVQNGTLDYADMTAAQKEVYKAYLDNEQKQKDLKAATEEFNAAKKAETLASYENQLALAKESGNYDEFKKSVVEAFEAGELSAEEARELIGKSMSEMSDDAQKTFMEDLPGDIKQGLDPSQYETTRKKLGDWFEQVGKGFIENIWNPIKDFWNNHIAKFFTAKWWGDLAKNAINGFLKWIFDGLNSLIDKLNSFGFELPDILGGGRIGFNIKKLDVPQLAKGAVLPANKPFLAMVGDQKHGTNIEAPLSTIQEAVALVMEDQTAAILSGFEASIGVQKEILEAVLGIQIGDDVIGQATARYNRKLAVMRGGV